MIIKKHTFTLILDTCNAIKTVLAANYKALTIFYLYYNFIIEFTFGFGILVPSSL